MSGPSLRGGDTDDFASKTMQAGGKVMVGITQSGFVSGSAYYSQGKVDSHYQSVSEVSGIKAGDGGFQLAVGGTTHLIGGQIASSADASKNILSTGNLIYEDLQNESKYKASQTSISGGSTMSSNIAGGISAAMSSALPQHESDSSQTKSGIAGGTIIVRNNPGQDLGNLDRNPTLESAALSNSFDPNKVAQMQEAGQLAAEVGFRAAGDVANLMNWKEGSPERTILHGVVAAGVASLGGGDVGQAVKGAVANQLVITAMAEFLESHGVDRNSAEFDSLMQAGSAAIGMVAGGATGSAIAVDATKYNYLTHKQVDALNDALAACTTEQCRQQAIDQAKRESLANDKALEISCAGADTTACYKGLGLLEAYYDNAQVPSQLRADQARDVQLERSPAFGDVSLWGGLSASVYAHLPQDGETGLFAAGTAVGYLHGLVPLFGESEGANPDNPFIPKQPGMPLPAYTDGMPSSMFQGTGVGQGLAAIIWALGTEVGQPGTVPVNNSAQFWADLQRLSERQDGVPDAFSLIAPAKRDTGYTVLGHWPDYVSLADDLGARYYQMPPEAWNAMSDAERWDANRKFLDRTISRGDDIILATRPQDVKAESSLEREMEYLKANGYEPTPDGSKMVRRNK